MSLLMKEIKGLYQSQGGPNAQAITELDWPYVDGNKEADADLVAKEINGYAVLPFTLGTRTYAAGELVDRFADLQSDGKAACGNWLYCKQYAQADGNKLKKRDAVDTSLNQIGLYPNWSWCWPMNRRIIYNRAAVDVNGNPWDREPPVLRWNGTAWEGDVIDGSGDPIAIAAAGSKNLPFILTS